MGCDSCTCSDNHPVTYLKQVDRQCVNCGSEITYQHSFSSGPVNGRVCYWHLLCPNEAP